MALVPATMEGISATEAAIAAGAQLVPVMYKDAKWAAGKIGRAWRKRRSNKKRKRSHANPMKHIGEPMTLTKTKRNQVIEEQPTDRNTRQLYIHDLTSVNQGAGEATRDRMLINAKGVEIAWSFRNNQDTMLFCNVAIVAPKHRTTTVDSSNFFRGGDGSCGVDFSIVLGALERHYLPLNTDKFNVLRHYRYQLGPDTGAGAINAGTGPHNFLSRKTYVKLNRQLRYDGTTSTCDSPVYFVYWFDVPSVAGGTAAALNAVNVALMHTMFFTDVL